MRRVRNIAAGKVALASGAALLAVALPSAVFAVGSSDTGVSLLSGPNRVSFTPASADPGIAALVASRAGNQARMARFTPAGASATTGDRSVTVAVRVDQQTARALSANAVTAPAQVASASTGGLSVQPTRYNLGIARGYSSFAAAPAAAIAAVARPTTALSRTLSDANIPDLSEFRPSAGARGEESRFAARIALDEGKRAERSEARASVSDQMLDVGGSYRLSRNIDITAGVRYEQDRDLTPLPDVEQQDSQAVYVGTQFRF